MFIIRVIVELILKLNISSKVASSIRLLKRWNNIYNHLTIQLFPIITRTINYRSNFIR